MPLSDDEKAPRAQLDETRQTVQEADEVEFVYRQAEQQDWQREQRAKASEALASLRRHLPEDRLHEIEDLLSTGFGCDFLRDALRRDHTRKALRKHVPVEHWQEIDDYLGGGVGSERVSAALQALDSEGVWRPRPAPGRGGWSRHRA